MKKILLAPDSFKGTMDSGEAAEILRRAAAGHYPDAEILSVPIADGGEGTVDCFLRALGGDRITLPVKGPYMEDITAFYGILPDGTAVIEMAAAAGLPLAGKNPRVEKVTTYGVGQLMLDAVTRGSEKILLGLGGSASNDLGCGAAAAMGAVFLDKDGNAFIPTGETLGEIHRIDLSPVQPALAGRAVVAMCDVVNPLFGKNGAAYVFAPQKGADRAAVERLDCSLRLVAKTISRELHADVADIPGAGAAGGMGAGAVAFFGADLQPGIDAVLDTARFDDLLKGADLVLTGEGKFDAQSLSGKAVSGVSRRAKRQGVPVIALVGDIGDGIAAAYDMGIAGIFSINRAAVPYREAKLRAKDDLFLTADNLFRFFKQINFPAARGGVFTHSE